VGQATAERANGLELGQVTVAEKSNESTAIPALLERLALTGCTVTIDAMGCQTASAEQIVKQDAEYVLPLKENQGRLYEDVRTVEKGTGHLEICGSADLC